MYRSILMSACAFLVAGPSFADENHAIRQDGAILSAHDSAKLADFDILAAHAHRYGDTVTFHMTTSGVAGATQPSPAGSLEGAPVYAYVWPTTLDPTTVGFEGGTGILAVVATSHPDFDDTPLYDENGDGDLANDGQLWHSHWVVLTPTEGCGEGALGVRDIPEGETPALPATWPGLPIFIDSPDFKPAFDGPEITITVPFTDDSIAAGVGYDGVTAALRVNANIHAPLLCVTDVFDVASGDLSLPGKIE
jgi:hypothetical protein